MTAVRFVVRLFSFCFHGVLALFLLAIAAVAWSSGQALHLEMLPGQGPGLTRWLFFSALAGLIALVLALRRTWAWLFVLWSLAVLAILVRALAGSYHFAGPAEFHRALYLAGGAAVAAWGAWWQWRRVPGR